MNSAAGGGDWQRMLDAYMDSSCSEASDVNIINMEEQQLQLTDDDNDLDIQVDRQMGSRPTTMMATASSYSRDSEMATPIVVSSSQNPSSLSDLLPLLASDNGDIVEIDNINNFVNPNQLSSANLLLENVFELSKVNDEPFPSNTDKLTIKDIQCQPNKLTTTRGASEDINIMDEYIDLDDKNYVPLNQRIKKADIDKSFQRIKRYQEATGNISGDDQQQKYIAIKASSSPNTNIIKSNSDNNQFSTPPPPPPPSFIVEENTADTKLICNNIFMNLFGENNNVSESEDEDDAEVVIIDAEEEKSEVMMMNTNKVVGMGIAKKILPINPPSNFDSSDDDNNNCTSELTDICNKEPSLQNTKQKQFSGKEATYAKQLASLVNDVDNNDSDKSVSFQVNRNLSKSNRLRKKKNNKCAQCESSSGGEESNSSRSSQSG